MLGYYPAIIRRGQRNSAVAVFWLFCMDSWTETSWWSTTW